MDTTSFRLSNKFKPINYKIFIRLEDLKENFAFSGEENVSILITEPLSEITLHSVSLQIRSAVLILEHKSLAPKSINTNVNKQTVTFLFGETTPENCKNATLQIEFSGLLQDNMRGFYRCKSSNQEVQPFIAATQFEATDARRVFPCVDEPAVKSTFEISLIVPKNQMAISNMNAIKEEAVGDHKKIEFSKTPIMSTYLVAFAVGSFDYVSSVASNGVEVRVFTPVGGKHLGQFALDMSLKVLPFFEEFFGIKYPLPKMDLIGYSEHGTVAMENWGLLTFDEPLLLIDPINTSAQSKTEAARIIAHEIAHQWFGNLVTMEWWTQLWLNEGFASYCEILATDHCFPEWKMWEYFILDSQRKAFELDCLSSSHPIEVEIQDSDDIEEIFDDISYKKGSSVLHMLNKYIGISNFRNGVSSYLKEHQYNNTVTRHLWDALKKESNLPIDTIMNTWTQQKGFPVVHVELDDTKTMIKLRQQHFEFDSIHNNDSSYLWSIPITYLSSDSKDIVQLLFDKKDTTIQVGNIKWIKLNAYQSGFYMVNYSQEFLDKLIEALPELSLLDKLGLQRDCYFLSRFGMMKSVNYLKFIRNFFDETDYHIVDDLIRNLDSFGQSLYDTDIYDSWSRFAEPLYRNVFEKIGGWKMSDHHSNMLRSIVIEKLGVSCCDESIITESRNLFEKFFIDRTSIHPDIRETVYRIVISFGGKEEYDKLLKICTESDLAEERLRCLKALGSSKKLDLINRTLSLLIDTDIVRPQDGAYVIASVSSNKYGKELAWEFVRKNWAFIYQKYGGIFLLQDLVHATTSYFASDLKLQEVTSFIESQSKEVMIGADRVFRQSIEDIKIRIHWKSLNINDLTNYLK